MKQRLIITALLGMVTLLIHAGDINEQQARQIATKRMVDEAEQLGADAIINIRYGSSAVMQGAAEVVAYGTAVKIL